MLDDDLKLKSADLTRREAKFLYRYHKRLQVNRIAIGESIGQLKYERQEPPELFHFFRRNNRKLETIANECLDIYADQHVPMRWMRAVGLGISQCVGIYCMIDIERAGPNVSSLWRYTGYDPSVVKLTKQEAGECIKFFRSKFKEPYVDEKILRLIARELNRGEKQLMRITRLGTKRSNITWGQTYRVLLSYPWNQELKEILFRVGLSFRRPGPRGRPDPSYLPLYRYRKAYEITRNEQGDLSEQADYKLRSRNWNPNSVAFKHYIKGKLPPGHLDARARRWAVKVFLVHLHQVLYYERYSKIPPKPYILDSLGKEHETICPKWPYK